MLIYFDRVDEIEQKIGAGLIEEVVQVAEGELQLVDEMIKYQVYVPIRANGNFLRNPIANPKQMGRPR